MNREASSLSFIDQDETLLSLEGGISSLMGCVRRRGKKDGGIIGEQVSLLNGGANEKIKRWGEELLSPKRGAKAYNDKWGEG